MERRLSPCLACAADRRDARLLRRLSGLAAASLRALALGLRLSRRGLARIAAASCAASRAATLPPTAFVNFLQNHDQIGNRALGERLESSPRRGDRGRACRHAAGADAADAVHGRGMGLERRRFPFFCDFTGDLADAVRKGRRKEFGWAYAENGDEVPDPLTTATFGRPCSTGTRREAAPARKRRAVRRCCDPRRDMFRTCGRNSARRAQTKRPARQAGTWGRRTLASRRQSVRSAPRARRTIARHDDLGRRSRRHAPAWSVFWRLGARDASRVPVATYRLQLTKDFDFDAAAAVVPYLKDLGVSHLYASPFLAARRDRPTATTSSTMPSSIPISAATPASRGRTRSTAGMGLILDFVPNHIGVGYCRQCLVARRAGVGTESPHAASSTSTGRGYPTANARRAVADPRQALWRRAGEAARSSSASTPSQAASPPGISSTGCRSSRSAMAKSPRHRPQSRRRRRRYRAIARTASRICGRSSRPRRRPS